MEKKKLPYSSGFLNVSKSAVDEHLKEINQRLTELEENVFRTTRKVHTPRAHQVLLMHHLGLLDKLSELNISRKKTANLLSILLNASASNIEDDLQVIHQIPSSINSERNYETLLKIFEKLKIEKIADILEDELLKIRTLKEKRTKTK